MGKKQVQKNISIFTDRVNAQFRPKKVLLFGSYASGHPSVYSDVDIIVISEQFATTLPEKRLDLLYDLTKDLTPDFHVFGFTPKEFDQLSPLTSIYEAKQYGITLSQVL